MNLLKISWANIKDKKLNSFLSALLLTLGIGMISLLLLLNKQLDEQFKRNIRGIDMVVGAKGSPLQLILSSIYQIDAPTGNVPLAEVNKLKMNPFVKTVIPLSMGDNYRGFRIVGTTAQYPAHFEATVAEGTLFNETLEVTLGSRVAEATGLKIGDTFASSHGLDAEGDAHDDVKYRVVGTFAPTGAVVDQLILTDLSSVWAIHEHEEAPPAGVKENDPAHEETMAMLGGAPRSSEDKEVTSALIQFRNPMGLITLPRQINANTSMQSALPSIEIDRLFSLLGVGIDTLRALALLIIFIAGVSVFVSLYNSLKERKYEMALMLSMGATRSKLFLMLLLEGLVLALVGFIAGTLLSRVGLWLFSRAAEQDYHYTFSGLTLLPEELYLLLAALLIGALAAALPSLGIYRLNISRTLAED
ncbi:ABC transporter permease [Rhabdobacter roseus]|uniref:Putative ABC transport system permease protein n=1 Tax=Rhabdobacter roseus TaxID=1655419 RepID=A0A840TG26_9BACT|nr:ABC transporter permease [Rhabdobacter roseus]MBB5282434.1 putative ABC transport system permease protein [Rhabdobacter roseus]